jgi:hypothetical protein
MVQEQVAFGNLARHAKGAAADEAAHGCLNIVP